MVDYVLSSKIISVVEIKKLMFCVVYNLANILECSCCEFFVLENTKIVLSYLRMVITLFRLMKIFRNLCICWSGKDAIGGNIGRNLILVFLFSSTSSNSEIWYLFTMIRIRNCEIKCVQLAIKLIPNPTISYTDTVSNDD